MPQRLYGARETQTVSCIREVPLADILGVGMTHFPGLVGTDERGGDSLARVLKYNKRIPAAKKAPGSWPATMWVEFGRVGDVTDEDLVWP